MFPNASPLHFQQRTASTLRAATERWHTSSGNWFDGTLSSVDARLARCDQLIHQLTQAGPNYHSAASELREDREAIVGLRGSMLNAHQDRVVEDSVVLASLDPQMLIEARAYVRENLDVVRVPTEMRERAAFFAARYTDEDTARVFAATCVKVAAAVRHAMDSGTGSAYSADEGNLDPAIANPGLPPITAPPVAPPRTAATFADFDDHHLFL